MNLETVTVSAVVGIIASAITAYITTRVKMREERTKWRQEFTLKYAEIQASDNARAQKLAIQFAVGLLIKNPEAPERERIFLPPNCRLIAGRAADNALPLPDDDRASRHHCAFYADDELAYVEDLGSPNATFVNRERVTGRRPLKAGDRITVGSTQFEFRKLDRGRSFT
jgi:pSer/pThr/pTyr-binding forkhead associated (FHA) protein